MTNLQQHLRQSMWMTLLAIVAFLLLTPSLAHGQSSQNTCSDQVVDYMDSGSDEGTSNAVEQTVCLYYDPVQGISSWVETDNDYTEDFSNEYGYDNIWIYGVGAQAQLWDGTGTVLVADSGMQYDIPDEDGGSPADAYTGLPNATYTPQIYNSYILTGLYTECVAGGFPCAPSNWGGSYGSGTSFSYGPSVQLWFTSTPALTLTTSGSPLVYGQPVTFTATFAAPGPTGTVNFSFATSGVICSGTINPQTGVATCTTSSLGIYNANESYTITANYTGDQSYTDITSNSINQGITTALPSPNLILTSSSSTSTVSQSVTFTASISGGATGQICFYGFLENSNNYNPVCGTISNSTVTVVANASNSLLGAVGSYAISAYYDGSSSYAAVQSNTIGQAVVDPTNPATITTSVTPSIEGQSVTFNVCFNQEVSWINNNSSIGGVGSVDFISDGIVIGTVNFHGLCGSFTTNTLAAGAHVITAGHPYYMGYYGSTPAWTYSASETSAITQVVNLTSTLSLTTSAPINPVTLTAVVSPVDATGTVTFLVDGISIGSTVIKKSIATLNTGVLTAGVHTFVANYSGDSNNSAATGSATATIQKPIPPNITNLSSVSGTQGLAVTIFGSGFGAAEGLSTVTFNGALAGVLNWSDSSITAVVPSTATTGSVVVTLANGQASNGLIFSVVSNSSCP